MNVIPYQLPGTYQRFFSCQSHPFSAFKGPEEELDSEKAGNRMEHCVSARQGRQPFDAFLA